MSQRPVMTASCLLLMAVVWAVALPSSALAQGSQIYAKAVLHKDGTRTESVRDLTTGETTDSTYDTQGVLICKKVFLLNTNGEPTQGVIYDGANNLIARVKFYFDNMGRVIEERCTNVQGQIFRRVIRQYDINGNALAPKAYDYAVNAPSMKPATINFSRSQLIKDTESREVPMNSPRAPGQAPQVMSVSPRTGAQNAAPTTAVRPPTPATTAPVAKEPEKKKRGFFGFGKKD